MPRKQPASEPKGVRPPKPGERDEPVKIPLDFDAAVRGLLAVDPDSEPVDEG